MKKILLTIILGMFLLSFASALETLGTFKQGEEIRVSQVCSDATYINISSIAYPNSSIAVSNIEMTSAGSGEFYYDFSLTQTTGEYQVRGISDGCEGTFATSFEVTLNGKAPPEGITIVVFTLIFIAIFGFGLISFLKALGNVLELNMDIIDTATMMATYFSMWIFYLFSMEYLGNPFVNEILEIAVSIGAFTHVLLPLVGFLVSFMLTNLKFKQKSRVTY